MKKRIVCGFMGMMLLLGSVSVPFASAMDLEPRRWGHMPLGTNVVGAGYAYTSADIFVDPVLQLEDVTMKLNTTAVKYIHSFGLLNKSARIEITQGYMDAKWTGLLAGAPASTSRSGWSDTFVRVAANLVGAPPLVGKEFAAYRKNTLSETIVGAAVNARLPTGEYLSDKLLNLGQNQYVVSPQLGVTHTHKQWTSELTGEIAFSSTNNNFYNGKTLKQDPLYFMQAHLAYTFRPGLWLSGGLGYNYGSRSSIDGVTKNDLRQNIGYGMSFVFPLNRQVGIKTAYLGTRTQESIGFDSDTITTGVAVSW